MLKVVEVFSCSANVWMKYQNYNIFCSAPFGVNKAFVTAFLNEVWGVEGPCQAGQHHSKELRLLKSALFFIKVLFIHSSPTSTILCVSWSWLYSQFKNKKLKKNNIKAGVKRWKSQKASCHLLKSFQVLLTHCVCLLGLIPHHICQRYLGVLTHT